MSEYTYRYTSSITVVVCFCFKTHAGVTFPPPPPSSCHPHPQAGLDDPLPCLPQGTHHFCFETACLSFYLPGEGAPMFVYLFPSMLCARWLFVTPPPIHSAAQSCHSGNVDDSMISPQTHSYRVLCSAEGASTSFLPLTNPEH